MDELAEGITANDPDEILTSREFENDEGREDSDITFESIEEHDARLGLGLDGQPLAVTPIPENVVNIFNKREGGSPDVINFEVDQLATPGFKASQSTIAAVLQEQEGILNAVDASNLRLDPEKGGKSIKQLKKEHGDAYITPTSAIGKYQITRTTLLKAIEKLGIDPSEMFDEAMQDRIMTEYLMRSKQPSLKRYFDNAKPTAKDVEKALVGLGKEWEAFDLKKNPSAKRDAIAILKAMHKFFNGGK